MINKKMLFVFDMLSTSDGKLPIKRICDELSISKRILLYNVDNMNYLLEKNNLKKIIVEKNYLICFPEETEQVKTMLDSLEDSYVLDSAERQSVIIICTGLCSSSISLEYLTTLFDVSRNTVLAEINKLKASLSKANIELSPKTKGGYVLSGNELNIRYLLMDHLHNTHTKPLKNLISSIVYKSINNSLKDSPFKSQNALFLAIDNAVSRSIEHAPFNFSQSSFHDITLYLMVIFLRNLLTSKENTFFDREVAENTEIMNAAHLIISEMNHLGLPIPESEGCYISSILLSAKLSYNYDSNFEFNPNLIQFVEDLMDGFEKQAAVSFTQRSVLRLRLLHHLQPMYYRLKFNIYTENPFYKEIIEMYHDLYLITNRIVKDVESRHHIQVPTPEIAYLCIYFGSYLASHKTNSNSTSFRILVVCANGVGTSILIMNQLQNLLGDNCYIESKDVLEIRVSCETLANYKLIVTTVPIQNTLVPTVLVHTIITENERDRILNWYLKNANVNMSNILEIIQKYASIQNKELLIKNLQKYFENKIIADENLTLRDIFLPQYLNYCRQKEMPYNKAVELSCKPLLRDGKITENYVKKNIQILEEFDLYSEIFPGVLLVHARPEDGVLSLGVCMTLFEYPVTFPDSEHTQIQLFITLAAVDNKQHLNALQQLIYMLESNGVLEYLLSLNMDEISTNDLYYRLINQIENFRLPPL